MQCALLKAHCAGELVQVLSLFFLFYLLCNSKLAAHSASAIFLSLLRRSYAISSLHDLPSEGVFKSDRRNCLKNELSALPWIFNGELLLLWVSFSFCVPAFFVRPVNLFFSQCFLWRNPFLSFFSMFFCLDLAGVLSE